MRKINYLVIAASFIIYLTSCNDKVYEKYTANVPVYLKHNELYKSIQVNGESTDLKKPGRIYFKDNYIYINEYYEGIHVIENANPANPVKVKFIKIPGNLDLAIKGNILYANNVVDLVALDISDLNNINEVGRIDSIFPYGVPEWDPDFRVTRVDKTKGLVIDWKIEEVKEELTYDPGYKVYNSQTRFTDAAGLEGGKGVVYTATSGSSNTAGIAGSMASFMIYDNYLYAIEENKIKIISIENNTTPVLTGNFNVGWGIETLFSYENKLFIGSQTGMFIYGLGNPENPELISTYSHIRSCDPVVVEGNYAYVTLRAGSRCGGGANQLDIIDLSNISNPSLIKSYQLQNPYGLGIDNGTLFICDGNFGLKIYDASNPQDIELLYKFPEINTFDVIPIDSTLIMIGNDGLYQYDYSSLSDVKLISVLPIISE